MRRFGTALIVTAVVLAAVAMVLSMVQRHFIFFPDDSAVPAADSIISGAQDVRLQTSDGLSLGAWFVPANDERRDITVLVANGNGGDRAGRAPLAKALSETGFDVLLFDYRGYGRNPGKPSQDGLARDARAAYNFLTQEMDVDHQRLLYFGESLGTGVVTELATEHPPAGILLRSPFTDLAAVGQKHYPFLPVKLLLRDRFPVIEYVRELDIPLTVVYGTNDDIVPAEFSREVANAAAGPTETLVLEAGHNDPVMFGPGPVVKAVEDLAARAVN